MINIEDKVHIRLTKKDLEDLIRVYFHNGFGIDLTTVNIVVGGISGDAGHYAGQDVKEVICEGKRREAV